MIFFAIEWLLAVLSLVCPILLAWWIPRVLPALAATLAATAGLIIALTWWGDMAIELQLWWWGVDFDGWTDEERLRAVAPDRREEALTLYWSKNRLRVGWPITAGFRLVYALPWTLLAFAVTRVLRLWLRKSRRA